LVLKIENFILILEMSSCLGVKMHLIRIYIKKGINGTTVFFIITFFRSILTPEQVHSF
jgi:hypothetical protein